MNKNTKIIYLFLAFMMIYLSGCQSFDKSDNMLYTQKYLAALGKRYSVQELYQLKELDLSYTAITDSGMSHLRNLVNLESLKLNHTGISYYGLEALIKNRNLRHLELRYTKPSGSNYEYLGMVRYLKSIDLTGAKISDEILDYIKNLKNLEEINLSLTGITDEGLEYLKDTTHLEALYLNETIITDKGITYLKKNKNIKLMDLSNTRITDKGLLTIAGLRKMESLLLSGANISEAGLQHIGNLSNLLNLNLSGTAISDTNILYLEVFTHLNHLNLAGSEITSRSFQSFYKLKSLNFLDISGIKTNPDQVKILRDGLPKVRIVLKSYIHEEDKGIGKIKEITKPRTAIGIGRVSLFGKIKPGLSIPFEVQFLDQNGSPDKNFEFKRDLIFRMSKKNKLRIYLENITKEGDEEVLIPNKKIELEDGKLRGRISLDSKALAKFKDNYLEVYAENRYGKREFVGSSAADYYAKDLGGVLFEYKRDTYKAGEIFSIRVYPFNKMGQPIYVNKSNIILQLSSKEPIYVNQKKIKRKIVIPPSEFEDGVALIKLRARKLGSYRIQFRHGQAFDLPEPEKAKKSWNNFSFHVTYGEHEKTFISLPNKLSAGATHDIKWYLEDQYGNRFQIPSFQLRIYPLPGKGIYFNGNKLKERFINLSQGKNELVIQRAGDYEIKGEKVDTFVIVNPLGPTRARFALPGQITSGERIQAKIFIEDKFGNQVMPLDELSLRIPGRLSPEGSAREILIQNQSSRSFWIQPQRAGMYQFTLRGFAREIRETVVVYPNMVDQISLGDSHPLKKQRLTEKERSRLRRKAWRKRIKRRVRIAKATVRDKPVYKKIDKKKRAEPITAKKSYKRKVIHYQSMIKSFFSLLVKDKNSNEIRMEWFGKTDYWRKKLDLEFEKSRKGVWKTKRKIKAHELALAKEWPEGARANLYSHELKYTRDKRILELFQVNIITGKIRIHVIWKNISEHQLKEALRKGIDIFRWKKIIVKR